MDEIIVTICCLAYNHENYIRQCLEGFIMQKTNFRFEAIVHDDASTDGTAKIIREYADKYPDIIKPILEKENLYSKKDGSLGKIMNANYRGKYIAICEGDDYWTDPCKLQKQVDFLETHPGFVVCSHLYRVYFEDKKQFGDIGPGIFKNSKIFNLEQHINGEWYTHPLTCVYLRSAIESDASSKYKSFKDFSKFYLLLSKGNGFLMNEVMGVYRIHKGGVWTGVTKDERLWGDLKCIKGIYDAERTDTAALVLDKYMVRNCNQFGFSFVIKNIKNLFPYWRIVARHFGLKKAFVNFLHELHIKEIFQQKGK